MIKYPIKQQNEGNELLIKIWSKMGNGIGPDLLELTGFFSSNDMIQLQSDGVSKDQAMEIAYGGGIHFAQFRNVAMRNNYRKVATEIERVLQIKKYAQDSRDLIAKSLKMKVHHFDDELIPKDAKNRDIILMFEEEYMYASDPDIAVPLLQLYNEFDEWATNPGYFLYLFAQFNAMIREIILMVASMKLQNLSRNDKTYFEPADLIEVDPEVEKNVEKRMNGEWE